MKIKYVFMLALFFFMSFSLHGMQQPNTDNFHPLRNLILSKNSAILTPTNLTEIKDRLTEMLENPKSNWNFFPPWIQASFLTECLDAKLHKKKNSLPEIKSSLYKMLLCNWANYLPFESSFGRATLEMAVLRTKVANERVLKFLPKVENNLLFDLLVDDESKIKHFKKFPKNEDVYFWYMILLSGIWKKNETISQQIIKKFIQNGTSLSKNLPEEEKLKLITVILESGIWKYESCFKEVIRTFILHQQSIQIQLSSVYSDPYSFVRSQVPFLETLILSEIWKTDERIRALIFDFLEFIIGCLERADRSDRFPPPNEKVSYKACKDLKIICAALLESRIFKYDKRLKECVTSSIKKAFDPKTCCWPVDVKDHDHVLISARLAYALLVFGLKDETVIKEKKAALKNIAKDPNKSDNSLAKTLFYDYLNEQAHKKHADFV